MFIFRSVLAVKKGVVVVAKPDGLGKYLEKKGFVRFSLPNEEGRDLRLEVISPHFNLTSGNSVFLCKLPEEFFGRFPSKIGAVQHQPV